LAIAARYPVGSILGIEHEPALAGACRRHLVSDLTVSDFSFTAPATASECVNRLSERSASRAK
jgi:hypothetical protein